MERSSMKSILCLLGFHKWKYFRKGRHYPKNHRICLRCGKAEDLVYDFLAPSWSDK